MDAFKTLKFAEILNDLRCRYVIKQDGVVFRRGCDIDLETDGFMVDNVKGTIQELDTMMEMRVALIGKKGSGKTWAAKNLVPENRIYSFASKLKEVCNVLWPGDYYSREGKEEVAYNGMTRRVLLQTVGEALRSVVSPTVWIDSLELPEMMFVVDDCRMANEVLAMWRIGVPVIRVLGLDNDSDTHRSETEMDKLLVPFVVNDMQTDIHVRQICIIAEGGLEASTKGIDSETERLRFVAGTYYKALDVHYAMFKCDGEYIIKAV